MAEMAVPKGLRLTGPRPIVGLNGAEQCGQPFMDTGGQSLA